MSDDPQFGVRQAVVLLVVATAVMFSGVVAVAEAPQELTDTIDLPDLDAPVTDEVGVLPEFDRQIVVEQLSSHREDTGIEMAVLIVDDIDGVGTRQGAWLAFERWASDGDDRGDRVLLVIDAEEEQSWLKLGYGVRTVITDATAEALSEEANRYLGRMDYPGAVRGMVDEVIERTEQVSPDDSLRPLGYHARVVFPVLFVLAALHGIVWRRRHGDPEKDDDNEHSEGQWKSVYRQLGWWGIPAVVVWAVFSGGVRFWIPALYMWLMVAGFMAFATKYLQLWARAVGLALLAIPFVAAPFFLQLQPMHGQDVIDMWTEVVFNEWTFYATISTLLAVMARLKFGFASNVVVFTNRWRSRR